MGLTQGLLPYKRKLEHTQRHKGCECTEERPCEEAEKEANCKPGGQGLGGPKLADTLNLALQSAELWEKKRLLLEVPSLWRFVVAALANEYIMFLMKVNPFHGKSELRQAAGWSPGQAGLSHKAPSLH